MIILMVGGAKKVICFRLSIQCEVDSTKFLGYVEIMHPEIAKRPLK
jgi:hypothetical protein